VNEQVESSKHQASKLQRSTKPQNQKSGAWTTPLKSTCAVSSNGATVRLIPAINEKLWMLVLGASLELGRLEFGASNFTPQGVPLQKPYIRALSSTHLHMAKIPSELLLISCE
jgi:hypothetical protein